MCSLDLKDYRSWPQLHVELTPGVTAFIGSNGQGKTNIIEAITFMATLASHRVSGTAPLIRVGQDKARVSVHAANKGRELWAHMLLHRSKANQAQINRSRCNSPREILGIVKAVLFAPEDLSLIRGEPAERRRYLDEVITLRRPAYAGLKNDYDKILRQRNALLKTAATARRRGRREELAALVESLDIWDEQLSTVGAHIMDARLELLSVLTPCIAQAYAQLAPGSRPVSLHYAATSDIPVSYADEEDTQQRILRLKESLMRATRAVRDKELERGISLIGPHRDDIELLLGSEPAKGFASHGETWSYALSLKLGVFYLLRTEGTDPILLLDDVFAELDARRRRALITMIKDAEQVLITCAVKEDLPEEFLDTATIHYVRAIADIQSEDPHARISILDPDPELLHNLGFDSRGEYAGRAVDSMQPSTLAVESVEYESKAIKEDSADE